MIASDEAFQSWLVFAGNVLEGDRFASHSEKQKPPELLAAV